MEIKRDILWRVYLCFIGMILLSVVIIGKAAFIQRVQGDHWRGMADSMYQKIQEISADRGTIFSEDGQMLSTSLPQFNLYMDFMADGLRDKNGRIYKTYIDSFATAMADYFKDKTAKQYRAEFDQAYQKGQRYYALKKKIAFEDYKVFRNFPLVRLGKNKSGIIVEETSRRVTPFGLLANRTIGLSREYTSSDGKVKKMNVGLEKSYDSLLNGQNGQRVVRYIAGGVVPVEGSQVEPENGKDIYTTLDVNIQDITETALMRMMHYIRAEYGTCVVMETKTGKIKAIANLGRVDGDTTYWEDDNYALHVTEPGSTFKLVTFMSVLDKGTFKPDDLLQVGSTGRMQVGPRMITDAEHSPKAVITLTEALAHSSNVGMGIAAYKTFQSNPAEFGEYIRKYHMNTKSPIDLTHIPSPRFAPFSRGEGGLMNMITMSFGYAVQVSPLQTLALYNAVANGGKMMKPYLVSTIRSNGVSVKRIEPEVIDPMICKESTLKAVREGLEMAVREGTGKYAFKDMPFAVAGKTGTAHVADGDIKYRNNVYQASFVGYFPAENPQYTCIVVVRTKPGGGLHYGGQVAAPVFREIATKVYAMFVDRKTPKSYEGSVDSSTYFYAGNAASVKQVLRSLNINYVDSMNNSKWVTMYAGNFKPVVKTNLVRNKIMPNVKGMGLRDAVRLLENMGLKIQIQGSGKVDGQSIAPGTSFAAGDQVHLRFG